MRIFGIIMAGFLLVGVLSIGGLAMGVISLPFHAASNGVDTAHGIIDKTINADNAIYNYEWFKQQVQDIKANQQKAALADQAVLDFQADAGDRSTWTFEDKTEYSRLRAIAQGLHSQDADLVANYNARASMANRSIFADGLIPNVLEAAASLIQ